MGDHMRRLAPQARVCKPSPSHADPGAPAGVCKLRAQGPHDEDNFAAMMSDGRTTVGDRLYVQGHPTQVAIVRPDGKVDFGGRSLPINTWVKR